MAITAIGAQSRASTDLDDLPLFRHANRLIGNMAR